jgi:hypothetical protein
MGSHATTTQVASANADTALAAANTKREKVCIQNASTAILYLLLGSGTASATNFTIALSATSTTDQSDYYEIGPEYTGAIKGFWASANGYAYVTVLS